MCGIAGILTARANLDMAPPLTRMLAALRHRGPDDEGQVIFQTGTGWRLGMAHTRLAILDLTPAGHQPMQDPATGSWITYNGEVYNHQAIRQQLGPIQFRSRSDTETILKGWAQLGDAVLSSLRGMFAFGLYDGCRRQLWLVRDRLGVKPLYVSRVGADTWVFASELRAICGSSLVPRRLNSAALESYLSFGAVTSPWTLVKGIQSVMPGECWRFDLGVPPEKLVPGRVRYWQPPFISRKTLGVSRREAIERLRPVLLEAVALRMVSDVPVGVFLSGGIDSSSLVAALAHQGRQVRTFSVVFGEHKYDESEHSRKIAQQFGTAHTELYLRPHNVLETFEAATRSYDQPSIDGLNTYFISQAARTAGVKVALSGLGGDEVFAGYPYFRLLARLERGLHRRLAWLIHATLRRMAPKSARTQKLGALLAGNGSSLDNYVICRQAMLGARRRSVLPDAGNGAPLPLPPEVAWELGSAASELDTVNAHSLLELSLYLANMLLRDTDQMSMAHAMEARVPLLDHVLVETVAGLHGSLKLAPGRHSYTKGLLVDALPTRLPIQILRRPKMGFVFPWERWLRNELKDLVAAVITDQSALHNTGLEPVAVQALWSDFLASRPGIRYTDVLCLVNLLNWVRQHGLTVGESFSGEELVHQNLSLVSN